jgi:glyoxylase-like metal-dependent hydrolase (beta-lactamase superfamily II)
VTGTAEYEQVTQIRMSRELDGKPVYWVSAYLADGLLIDTGCSHTSGELASFLEGRGLRAAVNTHYHEDHMGGNHDIMDRYGVDIYSHPISVPLIANRFELYPYQEIAWGYPVPTTVRPVPDVVETEHHAFQVVETPGHCTGHICLFEPSKGWCFTGDLFARENPKFIRPEENVGEIMKSMRKVMDLPTDRLVLFTAVGKIVEDGRKALGRCIDYFADLAAKVHMLHHAGLTIEETMQREFGGEHPFAQLTNNQFSTENLVRTLLETVPAEISGGIRSCEDTGKGERKRLGPR